MKKLGQWSLVSIVMTSTLRYFIEGTLGNSVTEADVYTVSHVLEEGEDFSSAYLYRISRVYNVTDFNAMGDEERERVYLSRGSGGILAEGGEVIPIHDTNTVLDINDKLAEEEGVF